MKTRNNRVVPGMPFFRWLNIAICVLLGQYVCSPHEANGKPKTKSSPVSYTVISNKVVKNRAIDYVSRDIYLMLDPGDFTEGRLRKLLDYLFKKYPRPHRMSVYLHSHPIQLRDSGMLEQIKPNDEARKYPYGRLSRIGGKEEISYTLPSRSDFITIIVKERKMTEPKKE